ncbi:hypothetical protein T4C_7102 [Trichinella pseudospiralis]|uniref:Uncharacterized protein n=1 Tax=Trichinella pseudospiralis TaxID=6337 RepID=A0A0V1HWU4_TRIPS|nr:hypothetical protein T4C_7102 [Trichinella pseudospiralis]
MNSYLVSLYENQKSYILETQALNSKYPVEASLAQPYRISTPKKSYINLVFF